MVEYIEMAENLEEKGIPIVRQIVKIKDSLFEMKICWLDELYEIEGNMNDLYFNEKGGLA